MKFFISSTYTDLVSVRTIAINMIQDIVGCGKESTGKIGAMEFFAASERTCKEECLVWLDPHHNLTDSPHYGTATKHPPPKSEHEMREEELSRLKYELEQVSADYQAAQQLLDEK